MAACSMSLTSAASTHYSESRLAASANGMCARTSQSLKPPCQRKSRIVRLVSSHPPHVSLRASVSVATKEAATGVEFPPKFIPPGLSKELSLLGTGVREKKFAIIAVKVYAVAVYLDTSDASATWRGQSGQDFFNGLATAPADKALILTLVRDVSSDQFVNALNEELVPKLTSAGADLSALAKLSAVFEGRTLRKDSAVILAWEQPQHLKVSFVEDVKTGYGSDKGYADLESLPLLNALFDLYLGESPIAPSLITSIGSNAASI